jgi:hypothetical protein
MPHPEEEAEKQERYDVHGFSHCARFKVASRPRNFHADTQNDTSARNAWYIRGNPMEGWGEP